LVIIDDENGENEGINEDERKEKFDLLSRAGERKKIFRTIEQLWV